MLAPCHDFIVKGKAQKWKGKGALAYSATEHQALLALLQAILTAFNGGESAPEWKELKASPSTWEQSQGS
jgi:hypothetical protein